MKLILLILAFVAVVTGFATMPANATTPERMTYGTHLNWGRPERVDPNWGTSGQDSLQFSSTVNDVSLAQDLIGSG